MGHIHIDPTYSKPKSITFVTWQNPTHWREVLQINCISCRLMEAIHGFFVWSSWPSDDLNCRADSWVKFWLRHTCRIVIVLIENYSINNYYTWRVIQSRNIQTFLHALMPIVCAGYLNKSINHAVLPTFLSRTPSSSPMATPLRQRKTFRLSLVCCRCRRHVCVHGSFSLIRTHLCQVQMLAKYRCRSWRTTVGYYNTQRPSVRGGQSTDVYRPIDRSGCACTADGQCCLLHFFRYGKPFVQSWSIPQLLFSYNAFKMYSADALMHWHWHLSLVAKKTLEENSESAREIPCQLRGFR
jgi:hypothetical protein